MKRYTAAQSDRMNAWIDQALHIRAETAGGTWRFPDDDSIIVANGGGSVAGGGASVSHFRYGHPPAMLHDTARKADDERWHHRE